jgi:GDP-4-dehydro-6-deoxy-D-mannose reductase
VKVLSQNHKVISISRSAPEDDYNVDLTDSRAVEEVLNKARPDALISCAGVVDNTEKAQLNVTFTRNLLEGVINNCPDIGKVIIMGSAAEYGIVDPSLLPINEDAPRNPVSVYGKYKVEEVDLALRYRAEGLPLAVARIFNPVGAGMAQRMLIPGILRQIEEIRAGRAGTLQISRLDARRDYIDVADMASAIEKLIDSTLSYDVYNIGSGKTTTNSELVELIVRFSGLTRKPRIIETMAQPEPLYACQADISRMRELGWTPEHPIEEVIREIMYA